MTIASQPQLRYSVALCTAVLDVTTSEPIEFVDLTDRINDFLEVQQVETGSVTVFSRHTTAAIKINEAEELLIEDFKLMLQRLCPVGGNYFHNDMARRKPPIAPDERLNGHSHCMHLLLSSSEVIPVVDSRLALGRWQRIFLVELDGPRRRKIFVRCASYLPREVGVAGASATRIESNGSSVPSGHRVRQAGRFPRRAS